MIKEDKLGPDVIVMQAKRWNNNSVGQGASDGQLCGARVGYGNTCWLVNVSWTNWRIRVYPLHVKPTLVTNQTRPSDGLISYYYHQQKVVLVFLQFLFRDRKVETIFR
ncbi:hypothetical protein [Gimesia chilikensis]|uniref:hypothetical protein n=1 Tax=Gimesia chilikensis TaxID=2605989 RepID=UPI0039656D23